MLRWGKTSHQRWNPPAPENQRCPESQIWGGAVTDSSFVVQHMRCNVSFPNKQPLLLQVRVKLSEGQAPRTTPGLLKTHNRPLCSGSSCLSEHALGWDCCFHLVVAPGAVFPLSSYSSPDFIAHTLGDDFVNETMHILAAFMMVMTSSTGTMEAECWDSGVMVVCVCVSVMGENLQNVNWKTTPLIVIINHRKHYVVIFGRKCNFTKVMILFSYTFCSSQPRRCPIISHLRVDTQYSPARFSRPILYGFYSNLW